MRIFLLFALTLLLCACEANEVSNANTNSSPTKSPTPTAEERDARYKTERDAEIKAYQDYVKEHYVGWVLKGFDSDVYPFTDLHISRNKVSKIVKVQYKTFEDLEGGTYKTVSKVTTLDLIKQSLEDAEESGAENAEDN